jgi:hypothetical protein
MPPAEIVEAAGAVAHEPTGRDVDTIRVNRWQAVPSRQRDDEIAVEPGVGIRDQHQAAVRHAREGLDGALNFGRDIRDRTEHKLDPKRRSRGLGCTLMVNVIGSRFGIDHQSGARKPRRDLLSIASHLPLTLVSNSSRPVTFPPGRAKL